MKKREAVFTQLFRHWLKSQPMRSAAFELKQTMTDSIPFSDVQEHQLDALMAASHSQGLIYKAPDDSRGVKPFDLFYLRHCEAYIVIKYPFFFCLILVEIFIREKSVSKRKSLTSFRAKEIASKVIEF